MIYTILSSRSIVHYMLSCPLELIILFESSASIKAILYESERRRKETLYRNSWTPAEFLELNTLQFIIDSETTLI